VIRFYDEAGNVIENARARGRFQKMVSQDRARIVLDCQVRWLQRYSLEYACLNVSPYFEDSHMLKMWRAQKFGYRVLSLICYT